MFKHIIPLVVFVLLGNYSVAQHKIDSLQSVLEKTTNQKARLDVLDYLTKELIRANKKEQENYLKEYLNLAQVSEEYDLMASKSRFLIQYYINVGQNEKAEQLCDSLLGFKEKYTKESSLGHLLLKRAAINYNKEQLDAAAEDYENSASLFLKSGDSIFAADALFFGGQALTDKNAFLEAIQNFKEAEQLYELLGDKYYALLVGSELTSLYSNNGFVAKSIQERERLVKKAKKNRNFALLAQLLGQNVNAYYKLEDLDKMQLNIKEMISVKDSVSDPYYKPYQELFILNYQLLLACKKKNVSEAKKYMEQLKERTQKNVSQYLKTDVLMAKAAYYELTGNDKALLPILESLSNIKTTNRLSAQTTARKKLADILSKKGDYKEVAKLYEINAKVKDSIYEIQKNNTFLYYQAEFETERRLREISEKEAEIKQLETEKKLAANRRNAITGILFLLFAGISLIIYIKNKQKLKEQAYQNILLNNKIATKTEEINELLTETMQHIKSKERIAENLQKLSNEKEGITLKSIIVDLKVSKADNEKLMLIKQNIERANFEFIKKLRKLHPDLTKTDIEICSLIRIGLRRKEVASIRNTSLEAVKSSRFRLKRKLNLSSEENLDDYIISL
ncbi:helix-turn-helix domain-containing protein [Tenacibaculum agarivorans]|uniref:hypothetical protein n=1 Tax=Tenacibaculum agarivorans TaxID=1908389 RepID=UPI00094B7A5F|nr:hypothetical protein [Tenacibaculum agarivorans]